MELKDFIENFVERNTLVRLWYKVKGGHELVLKDNDVSMEWSILKGEGKFGEFAHHEVIGVTDILMLNNDYSEAVNIVISPSKVITQNL